MFYEDRNIKEYLKQKNYYIVGYIRVANKENLECAIKLQKNIIKCFCRESNVKCKEYFIDNGFSGATFDRPAFKKMMNNNKIEVILIADMSKLSRSLSNTIDFMEQTDKTFISIRDCIVIKNMKKTNEV